MAFKTALKSLCVWSAALLALSSAPALADGQENTPVHETELKVETVTAVPEAQQTGEVSYEGWQKMAENDMEVVYFRPPPKGERANTVGIEVRVVAQQKDLFDYAEGVAMADCSTRTLFPVSGEIYDVKGSTINPFDIPLLKGMEYVRAFPQEAYDGLTDCLCEGEPIPEAN